MDAPNSSSLYESKPEVFISFRGEDCRSGFKSHLYAALLRKKINVYVDDQLRRGEEISEALLRAIKNSKFSVIIFTENYASSKWCLDELVKIMECKRNGQIVIPVFYKLDPSEVRYQKGKYADAFQNHKMRHKNDSGKLQKWRKALWEAASLSGWHSSAFRHESEFIDAIVNDLIQKLHRTSTLRLDTKGRLVGIEDHIARLRPLLVSSMESGCVKIIGLWGMGGIGKTTIAAALYARFSSPYYVSCFMENVREGWEKLGADHLKKDLLSKLFEEENIQQSQGPSSRNYFTIERLRRKRVFVVLDNINDTRQLDYLVGEKDNYEEGSIIIVTTRDRQIINKVDQVYEVQGMEYLKALELFSLVAFEQKYPPTGYTDLSQRVISYAAGNPLALRVYGSLLYRKSRREWESAVQKLDKTPNEQIMKVLSLSYESLDDHDKKIFLDIACFLKGESKGRIVALLDGCGLSTEIGLSSLLDKGLITTSTNNKILMHDLIHEMGQEIVRKNSAGDPRKYSRLWDFEDIYRVLKYNLGSEAVEGMFLDMSKINEVCLNPDVFGKMYNLRFLSFRASNDKKANVQLSGNLHFLPDELRILHWERYPLKSLPSTYCPEKLIELNLSHSQLEKLWDGVKNLPNLRSINLRFCEYLAELPNISLAKNLESIDIEGCRNLCLLPSSVFNIDNLTTIKIPGSGIHLKSLERINFSGCISLREFSVISENAKLLDLSGTSISELPPSIGYSNKLAELYLRDCVSLQQIPDSISLLECLEILDLSNCQKVGAEGLFPAIEGLQSLTNLKLDNCLSLSKIPDNLGKLSSLSHLSLSGSSIESLPPTMKHLSFLKELLLKDCKRLKHLSELPPSIQRLDATGCISLTHMSNLDSTNQHISLSFFKCKKDFQILKKDFDKLLEDGYSEEFTFLNCMKLDQKTVNDLVEGARWRIHRAAIKSLALQEYGSKSEVGNISVTFFLPGNQVPDCFSDMPIMELAEDEWRHFLCAFCFVLDASPSIDEDHVHSPRFSIGCKCFVEGYAKGGLYERDFTADLSPAVPYGGEYLCIWYDYHFLRMLDLEYIVGVRFEFFAEINGVNRVKKCGLMKILNEGYQISKM